MPVYHVLQEVIMQTNLWAPVNILDDIKKMRLFNNNHCTLSIYIGPIFFNKT